MAEWMPSDLVLLPDVPGSEHRDRVTRDTVMSVRWFEANGVLLVSSSELAKYAINAEDDPLDAGVDVNAALVTVVPDGLKRWSPEDGFYHA